MVWIYANNHLLKLYPKLRQRRANKSLYKLTINKLLQVHKRYSDNIQNVKKQKTEYTVPRDNQLL
jgi:NurA-like 5'-3' nuclease